MIIYTFIYRYKTETLNNMKIQMFIITAFFALITEANINRQAMFRKFHDVEHATHYRNQMIIKKNKFLAIYKVCTVQTCQKCAKLLSAKLWLSEKYFNTVNQCAKLIATPECCSGDHLLSLGF